jgi:spermidine/putrescine transport system permease protein
LSKFSLGKYLLPTYVFLAFLFLLFPIGYTFVFSFNDPFKNTSGWQGFTLDNWTGVCKNAAVCESFGNSIIVALTATIVSTVFGTMLAIAVTRYEFKFRSATNLLLFLPLATPEVVMGAGLAAQFFNMGIPRGLGNVIFGHILFTISFVVITVKARIATLDPKLEEAGRDLYAPPSQVFMKITFPLLLPGIMAAALLSLALSFDDYIVTSFNSGSETTFPKYLYAAALRGIPPEANVIGSAVFIFAVAMVLVFQLGGALKRKRIAKLAK